MGDWRKRPLRDRCYLYVHVEEIYLNILNIVRFMGLYICYHIL